MPAYLLPGVYVEEVGFRASPIEGVATGTAAFLGVSERGPIAPHLVTSLTESMRWFGGVEPGADRNLPHAVRGFFDNGGRRLYVCRIVAADAATASRPLGRFTLRAIGPGAWGNRIWSELTAATAAPGDDPASRFRLKLAYWSAVPPGFVAYDPFSPANSARTPRPIVTEDFDALSVDPGSADHYHRRLDGVSTLVRLDGPAPLVPGHGAGAALHGGSDGREPVGADDFIGRPDGSRGESQGLDALARPPFREVALVHAPHAGAAAADVGRAVIAHCEEQRFRFAIVDSAPNAADMSSLDPRASLADSGHAAFYYPWLKATDLVTGQPRWVPPGGHVAGIYARTDAQRGVFKAPANEIVVGASDLEFSVDDATQAVLNPRGINTIRKFAGRGVRVWGARTLSTQPAWKYVPVRRLFIFLEHSIEDGTRWAAFEPNDERLWARMRDTIRLFLRSQWRNGALPGQKEEEAFFVACDRTTMTEDDVQSGRLVCEIGVAPLRPAEFVVFRLFRQTGESRG